MGDESLIALLLGIPTAEALLYRRASNPWLDPVFKQLRAILFPGKEIYGVPFVSASLADSAPFKRIAAELVAPGGSEVERKHLVATINLEY